MRKFATLLLIPVLALAGCSTTPETPIDPASYGAMSVGLAQTCDPHTGGDAVDQIEVAGDFGTAPEVTFPKPLAGSGIETKVVIEGTGGELVGNQRVALHFTGFNSSTGEQFQGSEFGTENFIIQDLLTGSTPDFCHALTGVQVGSRVALLFDAQSAHGGAGVASLGIGESDGIVFIFDVVDAYLPKANGENQAPESGLPTVILAPSGQPGIQIPATDAPTEFKKSTLIKGSGEMVAIGDTVIVHYSGWTWQGEQFDSSWTNLTPASFPVSSDSLIEGFVQALEGATVGSQVIAVIPPELGYGDNAQGSIPANSTLIFVIDILGKE